MTRSRTRRLRISGLEFGTSFGESRDLEDGRAKQEEIVVERVIQILQRGETVTRKGRFGAVQSG